MIDLSVDDVKVRNYLWLSLSWPIWPEYDTCPRSSTENGWWVQAVGLYVRPPLPFLTIDRATGRIWRRHTLLASEATGSNKANSSTHLQILARISPLPVANSSPWGLGATEMTRHKRNSQHLMHLEVESLVWHVPLIVFAEDVCKTYLNSCGLEALIEYRLYVGPRIVHPCPWTH